MTVYVTQDAAEAVHDFIIEKTGGLTGVRNHHLLISPLEAIQDDAFYPALSDKVGFLLYSIVNNHPFADANKRTAIALCALFLRMNGYTDAQIAFFTAWAELVALAIATGKLSLDETRHSVQQWCEFAE